MLILAKTYTILQLVFSDVMFLWVTQIFLFESILMNFMLQYIYFLQIQFVM